MLKIRIDPSRNATCEIRFLLASYPPPLRILPQYCEQEKDHIELDYTNIKQNCLWGRHSIFFEKKQYFGGVRTLKEVLSRDFSRGKT
jgi:hypothetical protein